MSNPFRDLSAENHEQISKYLRFFRQKKEGVSRGIQREFADAKSDRLYEDMYTKEDMSEYTEYLTAAIRTQVEHDIAKIINMGALALNQVLENAQSQGVELSLDTTTLENQGLLEAVEKLNLDALPKSPKRGVAPLASFKDEAKAMREEAGRLEGNNSRLQAEVALLKQRLEEAERRSNMLAESKHSSEDASSSELRRLQRELEDIREENSKRVSETAQFQQMRKMMQSQSTKLRDLRRKLQAYEPDAAKEDDA